MDLVKDILLNQSGKTTCRLYMCCLIFFLINWDVERENTFSIDSSVYNVFLKSLSRKLLIISEQHWAKILVTSTTKKVPYWI